MNILVTGGAGFIGSHIVEALLKLRHNPIVVDNFNDYYHPKYKIKNIEDIKKHISVVNADICDSEALEKCFNGQNIEAVIHLAACAGVRPSIENAPLYVNVNVTGTLQVLEVMKKYGIKKMIFASSSSVYGNNDKVPFNETDIVDSPISPYAATKKAGELICHTYHHLYDISIACLRFFTVYGPRQRPDLAIYKFTDKIFKAEAIPFFGDGSMGRDYTYVDDIVQGVILSLKWLDSAEKRYDVFNVGESYPVKLADMVKQLEKATGKTAIINNLPAPPGDVNITYADICKAERILGYNPLINFEEGIRRFVSWFEQNRL